MKKFAPIALVTALVLTGCSSSPGPSSSPASGVAETVESETPAASDIPMEFEAEPAVLTVDSDLYAMSGMTAGKFNLGKPAEPDKELLSALKKVAPDADWKFIELTIDNREGSEDAFNHEIRAYDAAGEEYGFVRPIELLDPLREELGDEGFPFEVYEKLWEKYDQTAHPGAVEKFVMITGDSIPNDLKRVTVSFGGMVGEVDAITVDDAESQGMPMDF